MAKTVSVVEAVVLVPSGQDKRLSVAVVVLPADRPVGFLVVLVVHMVVWRVALP